MTIVSLYLAALAMLAGLAPCSADACHEHHVRAAWAIAVVASTEADPREAAAMLAGIAAHETGAATERQRGGPAVSYFGLEVHPSERAALLADPIAAARRALGIARRGWSVYACGRRRCDARHEASAAQLARCVESARRGGAWRCRNWRPVVRAKRRRVR
jgi:hypothetical protein